MRVAAFIPKIGFLAACREQCSAKWFANLFARTAIIAEERYPRLLDSVQVDYFVNETTERLPYGNI